MQVTSSPHNDQLLRQTRQHHVQLSAMADLKANMLLTMASLVITFSVPQVLEGSYPIPVILLIGCCLATIILAAYASMPKSSLRSHRRATSHSKSPGFNILFFGDFAGLTWEEFETQMVDVMKDSDSVYRTQINEIYTLGVFLAKNKYRYLRLAYVTFISGFLSSGLAFAITYYLETSG